MSFDLGPRRWSDQWTRTLRSYAELPGVARHAFGAVDARDAFMRFFMDCFHVKDWLKNDPALSLGNRPEKYVEDTPDLLLCADLCNGSKHLAMKPYQGGGGYRVDPLTRMSTGAIEDGTHLAVVVPGAGRTEDALDLAGRCLSAWRRFLASEQLPEPSIGS